MRPENWAGNQYPAFIAGRAGNSSRIAFFQMYRILDPVWFLLMNT